MKSFKSHLLLSLALLPATLCPAATFDVTASYPDNANGGDGGSPIGELIQGKDGNLYGTSSDGGLKADGTVFKLSPTGSWTDLVSFAGTNGKSPSSGLVQAPDGSFYGTTSEGGAHNRGTIFKIDPKGVVTTLVSFTGANGSDPLARLILGRDGALYGTTYLGGLSYGTVFRVTLDGKLTTLVSFKSTDGEFPVAALLQGKDGNFYGTTSGNGSDLGTVFQMTPTGAIKTLATFTGRNGATPSAALIQGIDGNFYGTTTAGGLKDMGTVFQMTPAGAIKTLVSFNGANGSFPDSPLYQASNGILYGTTPYGGKSQQGTVFELTPEGVLTTLVQFDGASGAYPESGLVAGPQGKLFGTTTQGGASDLGVVYSLDLAPTQTQTITFPALGKVVYKQKVGLLATASSKLPVTYSVISGKATITSDRLVTFTGVGPVVLAADQAGNKVIQPAKQVRITVQVGKATQTITPFKAIGTQSAPSLLPVEAPVASSGLPVKLSVVYGFAQFIQVVGHEGNFLLIAGVPGYVVLQADQPGNALYAAAKPTQISFQVGTLHPLAIVTAKAAKVGDKIPVVVVHEQGTTFTLEVTSGSAKLDATGQVLTITGGGDVVLEAFQPGDSKYLPTHATATIKVAKDTQTITFPAIPAQKVGAKVTLAARASSGLPITYTCSSLGKIAGNTVTVLGKGNIVVLANQGGNTRYLPATPARQAFVAN